MTTLLEQRMQIFVKNLVHQQQKISKLSRRSELRFIQIESYTFTQTFDQILCQILSSGALPCQLSFVILTSLHQKKSFKIFNLNNLQFYRKKTSQSISLYCTCQQVQLSKWSTPICTQTAEFYALLLTEHRGLA